MNIGTTGYDSRLLPLVENISRQVDRVSNRFFYHIIETKTIDGPGRNEIGVKDLISVASIKEDSQDDGTFDTTWNANDFFLYPRNANPTSTAGDARPFSRIQVSLKTIGTQDSFASGQSNFEIAGTWGYSLVTTASGASGTAATVGTTIIELGANNDATGVVEPGHTIRIADEMCYVSSTSGTSLTVIRGANGSTAAAHTGVAINLVQYPGPVVEAVIIQMTRLWRRKDSGFASQVGFQNTGEILSFNNRGLDSDVRQLLGAYKRLHA